MLDIGLFGSSLFLVMVALMLAVILNKKGLYEYFGPKCRACARHGTKNITEDTQSQCLKHIADKNCHQSWLFKVGSIFHPLKVFSFFLSVKRGHPTNVCQF